MPETYLEDRRYAALVEALLALKPCPVTGKPEAYVVHEALGEVGGIWPAAIKTDVSKCQQA